MTSASKNPMIDALAKFDFENEIDFLERVIVECRKLLECNVPNLRRRKVEKVYLKSLEVLSKKKFDNIHIDLHEHNRKKFLNGEWKRKKTIEQLKDESVLTCQPIRSSSPCSEQKNDNIQQIDEKMFGGFKTKNGVTKRLLQAELKPGNESLCSMKPNSSAQAISAKNKKFSIQLKCKYGDLAEAPNAKTIAKTSQSMSAENNTSSKSLPRTAYHFEEQECVPGLLTRKTFFSQAERVLFYNSVNHLKELYKKSKQLKETYRSARKEQSRLDFEDVRVNLVYLEALDDFKKCKFQMNACLTYLMEKYGGWLYLEKDKQGIDFFRNNVDRHMLSSLNFREKDIGRDFLQELLAELKEQGKTQTASYDHVLKSRAHAPPEFHPYRNFDKQNSFDSTQKKTKTYIHNDTEEGVNAAEKILRTRYSERAVGKKATLDKIKLSHLRSRKYPPEENCADDHLIDQQNVQRIAYKDGGKTDFTFKSSYNDSNHNRINNFSVSFKNDAVKSPASNLKSVQQSRSLSNLNKVPAPQSHGVVSSLHIEKDIDNQSIGNRTKIRMENQPDFEKITKSFSTNELERTSKEAFYEHPVLCEQNDNSHNHKDFLIIQRNVKHTTSNPPCHNSYLTFIYSKNIPVLELKETQTPVSRRIINNVDYKKQPVWKSTNPSITSSGEESLTFEALQHKPIIKNTSNPNFQTPSDVSTSDLSRKFNEHPDQVNTEDVSNISSSINLKETQESNYDFENFPLQSIGGYQDVDSLDQLDVLLAQHTAHGTNQRHVGHNTTKDKPTYSQCSSCDLHQNKVSEDLTKQLNAESIKIKKNALVLHQEHETSEDPMLFTSEIANYKVKKEFKPILSSKISENYKKAVFENTSPSISFSNVNLLSRKREDKTGFCLKYKGNEDEKTFCEDLNLTENLTNKPRNLNIFYDSGSGGNIKTESGTQVTNVTPDTLLEIDDCLDSVTTITPSGKVKGDIHIDLKTDKKINSKNLTKTEYYKTPKNNKPQKSISNTYNVSQNIQKKVVKTGIVGKSTQSMEITNGNDVFERSSLPTSQRSSDRANRNTISSYREVKKIRGELSPIELTSNNAKKLKRMKDIESKNDFESVSIARSPILFLSEDLNIISPNKEVEQVQGERSQIDLNSNAKKLKRMKDIDSKNDFESVAIATSPTFHDSKHVNIISPNKEVEQIQGERSQIDFNSNAKKLKRMKDIESKNDFESVSIATSPILFLSEDLNIISPNKEVEQVQGERSQIDLSTNVKTLERMKDIHSKNDFESVAIATSPTFHNFKDVNIILPNKEVEQIQGERSQFDLNSNTKTFERMKDIDSKNDFETVAIATSPTFHDSKHVNIISPNKEVEQIQGERSQIDLNSNAKKLKRMKDIESKNDFESVSIATSPILFLSEDLNIISPNKEVEQVQGERSQIDLNSNTKTFERMKDIGSKNDFESVAIATSPTFHDSKHVNMISPNKEAEQIQGERSQFDLNSNTKTFERMKDIDSKNDFESVAIATSPFFHDSKHVNIISPNKEVEQIQGERSQIDLNSNAKKLKRMKDIDSKNDFESVAIATSPTFHDSKHVNIISPNKEVEQIQGERSQIDFNSNAKKLKRMKDIESKNDFESVSIATSPILFFSEDLNIISPNKEVEQVQGERSQIDLSTNVKTLERMKDIHSKNDFESVAIATSPTFHNFKDVNIILPNKEVVEQIQGERSQFDLNSNTKTFERMKDIDSKNDFETVAIATSPTFHDPKHVNIISPNKEVEQIQGERSQIDLSSNTKTLERMKDIESKNDFESVAIATSPILFLYEDLNIILPNKEVEQLQGERSQIDLNSNTKKLKRMKDIESKNDFESVSIATSPILFLSEDLNIISPNKEVEQVQGERSQIDLNSNTKTFERMKDIDSKNDFESVAIATSPTFHDSKHVNMISSNKEAEQIQGERSQFDLNSNTKTFERMKDIDSKNDFESVAIATSPTFHDSKHVNIISPNKEVEQIQGERSQIDLSSNTKTLERMKDIESKNDFESVAIATSPILFLYEDLNIILPNKEVEQLQGERSQIDLNSNAKNLKRMKDIDSKNDYESVSFATSPTFYKSKHVNFISPNKEGDQIQGERSQIDLNSNTKTLERMEFIDSKNGFESVSTATSPILFLYEDLNIISPNKELEQMQGKRSQIDLSSNTKILERMKDIDSKNDFGSVSIALSPTTIEAKNVIVSFHEKELEKIQRKSSEMNLEDGPDAADRISLISSSLKEINFSLNNLLSKAINRNINDKEEVDLCAVNNSFTSINHFATEICKRAVSVALTEIVVFLKFKLEPKYLSRKRMHLVQHKKALVTTIALPAYREMETTSNSTEGIMKIKKSSNYFKRQINTSVLSSSNKSSDTIDDADIEMSTVDSSVYSSETVKQAYLQIQCNENSDKDSICSGYASTLEWDEYIDNDTKNTHIDLQRKAIWNDTEDDDSATICNKNVLSESPFNDLGFACLKIINTSKEELVDESKENISPIIRFNENFPDFKNTFNNHGKDSVLNCSKKFLPIAKIVKAPGETVNGQAYQEDPLADLNCHRSNALIAGRENSGKCGKSDDVEPFNCSDKEKEKSLNVKTCFDLHNKILSYVDLEHDRFKSVVQKSKNVSDTNVNEIDSRSNRKEGSDIFRIQSVDEEADVGYSKTQVVSVADYDINSTENEKQERESSRLKVECKLDDHNDHYSKSLNDKEIIEFLDTFSFTESFDEQLSINEIFDAEDDYDFVFEDFRLPADEQDDLNEIMQKNEHTARNHQELKEDFDRIFGTPRKSNEARECCSMSDVELTTYAKDWELFEEITEKPRSKSEVFKNQTWQPFKDLSAAIPRRLSQRQEVANGSFKSSKNDVVEQTSVLPSKDFILERHISCKFCRKRPFNTCKVETESINVKTFDGQTSVVPPGCADEDKESRHRSCCRKTSGKNNYCNDKNKQYTIEITTDKSSTLNQVRWDSLESFCKEATGCSLENEDFIFESDSSSNESLKSDEFDRLNKHLLETFPSNELELLNNTTFDHQKNIKDECVVRLDEKQTQNDFCMENGLKQFSRNINNRFTLGCNIDGFENTKADSAMSNIGNNRYFNFKNAKNRRITNRCDERIANTVGIDNKIDSSVDRNRLLLGNVYDDEVLLPDQNKIQSYANGFNASTLDKERDEPSQFLPLDVFPNKLTLNTLGSNLKNDTLMTKTTLFDDNPFELKQTEENLLLLITEKISDNPKECYKDIDDIVIPIADSSMFINKISVDNVRTKTPIQIPRDNNIGLDESNIGRNNSYFKPEDNLSTINESKLSSKFESDFEDDERIDMSISADNANVRLTCYDHTHPTNDTQRKISLPRRAATEDIEEPLLLGSNLKEKKQQKEKNADLKSLQTVNVRCSTPLQIRNQLKNSSFVEDFDNVIIMDNGSGSIKSGLRTYDSPLLTPTMIGTANYKKMFPIEDDQQYWIGDEANQYRGMLKLKHPIQRGIIHDWDAMEMLWDQIFNVELSISPEDYPILQTESPNNPKIHRERLLEIMFETYNTPAYYTAAQGVMALYECGRTTGVVLGVGDGVTNSLPVYDGYCLPHASKVLNIGGSDITYYLQQILSEKGINMRTSAEFEILRQVKEQKCSISKESIHLEKKDFSEYHTSYELPDGQIISLDSETVRSPEILFQPVLIGQEHNGVHELLYNSIQATDIDLRAQLFRNIILTGGSTSFEGFEDRLKTELMYLHSTRRSNTIKMHSEKNKIFSCWNGASILSSLSVFSNMLISKDEYFEHGKHIVHAKCF